MSVRSHPGERRAIVVFMANGHVDPSDAVCGGSIGMTNADCPVNRAA